MECRPHDTGVKDRQRQVPALVMAFAALSALCVYTGTQLSGKEDVYVTIPTRRNVTVVTRRDVTYNVTSVKSSCNGCFRLNYKKEIDPKRVCSGGSGRPIIMVIVITTATKNAAARESIRNSWAKFAKNNTGRVRYVFLVGLAVGEEQRQIGKESEEHGDILQEDYSDTYEHLTVKVLTGLRWVLDNCPTAKYVMRAADDTYVNVPGVVHLVEEHDDMFTDKMFGHCLGRTLPLRRMGHRWYISYETYPHTFYPPYCIGTTFLMKLDLARRLVDKSKNVPYFKLEDVYFGLVLDQMNASTLHVNGFNVQYTRLQRHPAEQWYTIHKVSQFDMVFIWSREKQRFLVYKHFYRMSGPQSLI